ncbi:MAG: hypothetical protein U0610_24540, partial [bacterium]
MSRPTQAVTPSPEPSARGFTARRQLIRKITCLALCATTAPACTTIRAAHELASSNPVCGIAVSESIEGQSPIIEWTADYRLPPAFDAMLWVPGYVVTRRGRFAVPVPISTAIALERGADRPERLPPARAVELQTCTLHLRFATPETHRMENAEGLVILRARVREFEPRRTAIVALDDHGG